MTIAYASPLEDPLSPTPDRDQVRVQVVLVDDETVVTETLALVLEETADVEVHRSSSDLERCVALCRSVECDVVVVGLTGADSEIPLIQGLLHAIPDLRLLAMPNRRGQPAVSAALGAGAVGHLSLEASVSDVLDAITVTCVGGSVLSGDRLRSAAHRLARDRRDQRAHSVLTPRELEVLRLISAGVPTRAVAQQLGISLHTARTHAQNVLTKLGLHSRLEAAAYASRLGLLPPG
jgi:DNA-binding NarL/FixJ family response regulator